ncbi:DUF3048 domain-containing protein [Streptomyces sp. NPDC051963]|uniref:DUF3048 domain-containing protein n=1 Tax=Streptomyces sp. NPDC051963 TaxID=3365678 RepID=UPI0037D552CA
MGRKARTRRAAIPAALLAAAMTLSLAAGCTSPGGSDDDGRGSDRGQPSQSRGAGGDPILAVKIDNARAARPHTGLDSANIVYVEQVEGGLSRLMAVYATKLPKVVGPVRSARESDLELLRQFDRPTLAFSGAQHKLLPLIDKAPLTARSPEEAPGAFYRGTSKPSPHNLYLRPFRLMSSVPGADALTTGFHYGSTPSGGRSETSRTVRYPGARFTFTWSEDQSGWLVSMDGAPAMTDGERMAPPTVVVQYVNVRPSSFSDFLGNNTPYTETVGEGRAEVLRDGKVFEARWKRLQATDNTEFTQGNGAPLNFARGQVWVVFAKG